MAAAAVQYSTASRAQTFRPWHHRKYRVVARVVRHQGTRFRSTSLATHISYLKRDGVTRDGVT